MYVLILPHVELLHDDTVSLSIVFMNPLRLTVRGFYNVLFRNTLYNYQNFPGWDVNHPDSVDNMLCGMALQSAKELNAHEYIVAGFKISPHVELLKKYFPVFASMLSHRHFDMETFHAIQMLGWFDLRLGMYRPKLGVVIQHMIHPNITSWIRMMSRVFLSCEFLSRLDAKKLLS